MLIIGRQRERGKEREREIFFKNLSVSEKE